MVSSSCWFRNTIAICVATNEWEVDYWKREVITFVVEFSFFICFRFPVESQGKQTFGGSSIIYFKLILIDEIQIIP